MRRTIVFLLLGLVCSLQVHAAGTAASVFQTAARSTVVVFAYDLQGRPSVGTGVVLPEAGIVTNCHVIHEAARIVVRFQEREFQAYRRLFDSERDVCTIMVSDLDAPAVQVGTSLDLRIGERVYAIGTPRGLELTLSEGIVSGFRMDKRGRYIQTTTPVSPGSSGGGLFDEQGQLVGLMSFTMEKGQNLNFALPVEWITELLDRHAAQEPAGIRVDISETEDGRKLIRITD